MQSEISMEKQNCWEFKKCGRESGGAKVKELGECPAAGFTSADGFAGGKNGGRACAYLTGTFCGGNIQGTFRDKEKNCADCEFYLNLKKEHGNEMSVIAFSKFLKTKNLPELETQRYFAQV